LNVGPPPSPTEVVNPIAVSVTTGEDDAFVVFEGMKPLAPLVACSAAMTAVVQQGRRSQTSQESEVILLQVV